MGNPPGMGGFDLTQLQTFTFEPQVEPLDNETDAPQVAHTCGIGTEDEVVKRAAEAIRAVLEKCNNSIERLQYGDDCPIPRPGHDVIR